jgi:hypothetical protein
MAWYDFVNDIPGMSGVADFFDDPFGMDKQEAGLNTAAKQSRELGEQLKNFQMEGLNKAQGYFQPMQQQIESVYGPPGAMRK